MRHDITLLAQRRHHMRIPNKRLHQQGLNHPRLSPKGLYQLLRYYSNPRTGIHEDVYLSNLRLTGNRKTPRDMLHHCLRMRFIVHRVNACIAKPAKLQDRDTRVRSGAGVSKLLL